MFPKKKFFQEKVKAILNLRSAEKNFYDNSNSKQPEITSKK